MFRSLQSPKSRKTVKDELELQEISNHLIYVKFLRPFLSLSECKNDFYLVDVGCNYFSVFLFLSLSLSSLWVSTGISTWLTPRIATKEQSHQSEKRTSGIKQQYARDGYVIGYEKNKLVKAQKMLCVNFLAQSTKIWANKSKRLLYNLPPHVEAHDKGLQCLLINQLESWRQE